jgi:hypothetical protein
MRWSWLALCMGTPLVVQAQQLPVGLREAIVAGGLSGGKTYQVAQHCGASAELLQADRARFDADIRSGEAGYAKLGISVEQVFRVGQQSYQRGREEGDDFYTRLKSTPNRDMVCSQTLALVKAQAAKP